MKRKLPLTKVESGPIVLPVRDKYKITTVKESFYVLPHSSDIL